MDGVTERWPVQVQPVDFPGRHPFVRVTVGEVVVALFVPYDGEQWLEDEQERALRDELLRDHELVVQTPPLDRPGWMQIRWWPEQVEPLHRAAAAAAAHKAIDEGDPCRPILVSSVRGTVAVHLQQEQDRWTASVQPLAAPSRDAWRSELAEGGALLLVDVDRMKAFNDAYRNVEGDSVLAHVEMVLSCECRARELSLYRVGGNRFAVPIPAATQDPVEVGEALRDLVASLRIPFVHPAAPAAGVLTVSVGIGRIDAEAEATDAYEAAEQALGEAKRAGGNRVA